MFTFIETKLFSSLIGEYLWMLTVYAKNEEQNVPAHVLRRIKEAIDG